MRKTKSSRAEVPPDRGRAPKLNCSNYKFVSLQIYLHPDDDDTDKFIYLEIYLHSDDGDTDVL